MGEFQKTNLNKIEPGESDHKGRIDLVTEIDRESEERLVEALRTQFPDDSILAEEETAYEGSNARKWIIDPLDGTTNYVHGHPFYGISIGLKQGTTLTEGYAYFPEMDELFRARNGEGAYKNDTPISVNSNDNPINCLLATGFADMRTENERYNMDVFQDVIEKVQGIRRAGSAVHDLCMVADGVFDGFWEFNLEPWDVAAGAVIIREAGGTVTDMTGGNNWLEGGNILASNGVIHEPVQQWLEPYLPDHLK